MLAAAASSIAAIARHKTRNRWSKLEGKRSLGWCRRFLSSLLDCSLADDGNAIILGGASLRAPWLWSNCPKHVHESSFQRLKTPADYKGQFIRRINVAHSTVRLNSTPLGSLHPTGIGPVPKHCEGKNMEEVPVLEVEWSDGETSTFSLSWLVKAREPMDLQISKEHSLRSTSRLPRISFGQSSDADSLFLAYESLFDCGAVIVEDCPRDVSAVDRMGKILAGSLSHGSLYGDLFHVRFVPQAHNLAYTSQRLEPHQDLAYYESPPGLQLLLCCRPGKGGASILVDAMAAAHEFRSICPNYFDTLSRIPATFVKQRYEADMVYRRPHIQLQEGQVTAVFWSPPFEGPLLGIGSNDVNDYYTAYAAYTRLVDSESSLDWHHAIPVEMQKQLREYAREHTWEYELKEGEMLIFNNRRMLHGRRAFDAATGERHLCGAYTNLDDPLNRYKVMRRERGIYSPMLSAGIGNAGRLVQL